MTMWAPELSQRRGPRYLAIANALADDLASGRVEAGARLPTHRDLAHRLGVTVGTVSRAYAEAERRGLIRGEVGRGTFVRGAAEPADESYFSMLQAPPPGIVDFTFNLPLTGDATRCLAATLGTMANEGALAPWMDYQPELGAARHRAAGAAWIARSGLSVSPDRIAVTNGAQHGMDMAFSALTKPGDVVLTEALTYPTIKTLAARLGLRLHGLPMDDQGILPDALDATRRTQAPTALHCIPDLQNPTTAVMSEDRRRDIADIARRHGLLVIEDDVYGFLLRDRPRPLACHLPELTYHVTSISKSIAPGLRVGYVATPADGTGPLATALLGNCRMATPLTAEVAARWIEDGTAARLADAQKREVELRQVIADSVLGGLAGNRHPESFHIWLSLPEPWRANDFVNEARRRGALVAPPDVFVVGRGQAPHAVRICLGAVPDRDTLARGLQIVVDTLADSHQPSAQIV